MMAALAFAGAIFFFAGYLALLYFSTVLWQGLLASALLFLLVLICTGMGRILLRAAWLTELSQSERTLIGCTLGIGLLSQGMFFLGVLGLFKLWAVLILLSLFWIVGFTELADVLKSLTANRNLIKDRPAWLVGILGFLALGLWTSWVPPHQYDTLVYHLELAANYVRQGRIVPLDYLIYSHFPQNAEMLFGLSLLLGSDILAQMFSWLALLLSLLWIFEMGKREMPLTAALLAGLLLVSHSSTLLLSGTAYVEVIAMLWVTASVLSFCRWSEQGGSQGGRGWLALSAVFAGLGIGTKYYIGICPAVLELMILLQEIKKRSRSFETVAVPMVFFFALTTICAAPWLVKNWVVVGNPVFPFLYNRLPHHGTPWDAENAQRYFAMLTEYGHNGHFWLDLVRFPYMAFSGDIKFGGGMDVLGNLGWGSLLALVPGAIFVVRKNTMLRLLMFYCILHGFLWFCTGVVLRYLVVIVPLLYLPTAAGIHQCWNMLERRWRAVLASALTIFIATNLGLFMYVHTLLSSWNVLLGLDSREQYLTRKLDYYSCARYAQEHLGKNDKILIVGEQRGYYVTQDHVATTPMAPNRFVQMANDSAGADDLVRRLKTEGGFTHLMIVPREAKRISSYGVFDFTDQGSKNWKGLEDGRLKEVFAPGPCALLEIL